MWPREVSGTSLWHRQTSPGQREQPGRTDLSPLHMGTGHVSTHCCIACPCELRPLRAASPRDDWKHSHVSIWRTALFLAPSEAEGGLSHSRFHLCAGAKHNRRRCLFFRLPGQQDFLPRYGASPRSSAPAPQICIKGDFFKKRDT